MVRVMSVGVLVALALALASLALIDTAQSARADDYDDCYWLNMEGISEETQQATRDGLESRGWYSAPQTASMPSTAPVAALWARWAVRHEASEAPTRVFFGHVAESLGAGLSLSCV